MRPTDLSEGNGASSADELAEEFYVRFEGEWKRFRLAEPPRIADYLHPVLPEPDRRDLVCDLLKCDIEYRRQVGRVLSRHEYQQQLPDYLKEIDSVLAQPPTAPALSAGVVVPFASGLTLGSYRLERILGSGGQGSVWLARDQSLSRDVAIKTLSKQEVHPELLARLLDEARFLAKIQHHHIVHIYEAGEHHGQPYLVLEYVEGGSLEERLAGQPLPPREAATIARKLASALEAAHLLGIIHRDLKPANVLMAGRRDQPLGDCTPKLTDFGLAKQLDRPGRTEIGQVMGTPAYMAPEQVTAQPDKIDVWTDVYGLGAVLFQMLSGQPPFKDSFPAIRDRIRLQEPVWPDPVRAKIPRDLKTICLKCLHKEPKQRYASAQDLAADLSNFLAGEPLRIGRPVGPLERFQLWCWREPRLALSVGLAVGAVIAFVLVSTIFAVEKSLDAGRLREANLTIRKKQEDTDAALAEARKNLLEAAHIAQEQGITLCQQGEVGHGLLWFAHSLRVTPTDAVERQRSIRRQIASWRQELNRNTQEGK